MIMKLNDAITAIEPADQEQLQTTLQNLVTMEPWRVLEGPIEMAGA